MIPAVVALNLWKGGADRHRLGNLVGAPRQIAWPQLHSHWGMPSRWSLEKLAVTRPGLALGNVPSWGLMQSLHFLKQLILISLHVRYHFLQKFPVDRPCRPRQWAGGENFGEKCFAGSSKLVHNVASSRIRPSLISEFGFSPWRHAGKEAGDPARREAWEEARDPARR